RTGTADTDRERRTGDVADADRGGERRAQRLVVRDVALAARLVAAHEREPQRVDQHAELQTPQPDREVHADDEQEWDEEERPPDEGGRGIEGRLDGVCHYEAPRRGRDVGDRWRGRASSQALPSIGVAECGGR